MAWVFYKTFKKGQLDAAGTHPNHPVDFDTNTLRLMLLTSTTTIDQSDVDVADVISGASDTEVSGTNYARKSITSIALAYSGNNVKVNTTMADPSYAQHASGFNNAKHAVLYKFSTADASSPVIASYTFSSNQNNTSGTLTLQFSSSNIFTLS